jgi:ATP-dependent protease ClpP protease subunit
MNTLYYGDNLKILRDYIKDESVDLIYLDPPFNSNRNYNVLFKDESGAEADSQITAFEDTWHWNPSAEETNHELINKPDQVGRMNPFDSIGTNGLNEIFTATIGAVLLLLLFCSQALTMDFTWVEGPADSVSAGPYIKMAGDINTGDFEKFKAFVRKNLDRYKKNRFVHLSSNGGNLIEALKIAELLRSMYPNIRIDGGNCASSCFFLYLSGTTRNAFPPFLIGIHRAYFDPKYFAELKPDEARKQQMELTKLVNSILDENGVPQGLKDKMNETSSNDIYWLAFDEVESIGNHPAWYEELMIAKCDYGKVLALEKRILGPSVKGEDLDSIFNDYSKRYLEFSKCEDKVVNAELSQLAISLASKKR